MEDAEGGSVDTLLGKVWVLTNEGTIAESKGRRDEAATKYRAAATLAEKAQRFDPRSDKALYGLATTQMLVGGANEIRLAHQTLEKLVARHPSNALWQSQLAASYEPQALGSFRPGQFRATLSAYRQAYAIPNTLRAQ